MSRDQLWTIGQRLVRCVGRRAMPWSTWLRQGRFGLILGVQAFESRLEAPPFLERLESCFWRRLGVATGLRGRESHFALPASAELVADEVDHGLPEVGPNPALAGRLELLFVPQSAHRGALNEVLGVDPYASLASKPPPGPSEKGRKKRRERRGEPPRTGTGLGGCHRKNRLGRSSLRVDRRARH